MILKRKLLLVFAFLFILSLTKTIKAQPTPSIGIVLNEYCTTNLAGPVDNFGVYSDWVEIANVQSYSLTLANYYLSNDRNNLKKWAFPSSFNLSAGGLGIVWLSGKNGVYNGNYHASFTLDQCKNQWLILSTSAGTVRDSIFIQQTKAGHTRGRVDYNRTGIKAWKLYTTHSQMLQNPLINNYIGYLPKPSLAPILRTNTVSIGNATTNTGYFATGAQDLKIIINGRNYDTINYPCYSVYYTTNGEYPRPGTPFTTEYLDSATSKIALPGTAIVRAIVVARTFTNSLGGISLVCPETLEYLESFCETNTYFLDPAHQTFKPEFGVVSIALDIADTTWFSAQGNPPSTTVHVEYYDNKKQVSEGYGSLERPINETWATVQRGFNVSIDDRNGFGCNFEGPIFNLDTLGSSKRRVFPTLQLYSGDIDSHSSPLASPTSTSYGTGLRDVFIQSLAARYNLNVSPLHIKPVIAFVNGDYWGVFNFKEVYDKHYEAFYNSQSRDSVDMCFYHNGEGSVSYADGSKSNYNNNFKSQVVDKAAASSLKGVTNPYYTTMMANMDKTSLMDLMILNSFFMNSNTWNYNLAFAKGPLSSKPGSKYHFYLWNMPAVLNFSNVATNTLIINNTLQTPCIYDQGTYPLSTRGYNAAGYIFNRLMNGITGNDAFKLEYKNRYQDLLNSALKCDNLKSHFNYIKNLYSKEMKCHENSGCGAGINPFNTNVNDWDTNMVFMQKRLLIRCDFISNTFTTSGCYGVTGPTPLTVRVEPEGAGYVKVNSLTLDKYPWTGNYYATLMSFKATPSNTTTYTFHHWKFQNHKTLEPSSKDSVTTNFFTWDDVTAVFTDKTKDLANGGSNPNVPTAFTPNGDGNNDTFKALGSSEFVSEYQMSIWNRWGEEVFRTVDPNDNGWDGNFNGQQALTGVYAYVITYKNVYGESKILKGNVTLLR